MFDPADEVLPAVTVAPVEQRAKRENEIHFLSQCSHIQVLSNTNLYLSKVGEEKLSILSILRITWHG